MGLFTLDPRPESVGVNLPRWMIRCVPQPRHFWLLPIPCQCLTREIGRRAQPNIRHRVVVVGHGQCRILDDGWCNGQQNRDIGEKKWSANSLGLAKANKHGAECLTFLDYGVVAIGAIPSAPVIGAASSGAVGRIPSASHTSWKSGRHELPGYLDSKRA
ncbi:hypothetical protein BO82DRAFT_13089 [Aspergillus uvarum CBS 121591]|uniref:Uncharacterized protein n=1 Tax=Aspergillus uvarum CBS 121591 TaxID=1448315 RepID=A0A319CK61_9EURO|nr:hypothetical protein BO82DRAFT_13089 [Aspergillus uvarum CBS 121591]PYH75808.1 hypothetical protein BO82DRAFT_13089 [Aspergillus uvarum CBS 121591]